MKWEYKIERLAFSGVLSLEETDSHIQAWLNSNGIDGWELIKINQWMFEAMAIFKRPVRV